jgi:hypothetical protein
MENEKHNKQHVIIYKRHIIDLHPITIDMMHHISNMQKEDIQELLLCFDSVIQNLLKNGY